MVVLEPSLGHDLLVVTLLEGAIVVLGGEERVEARDLGALGALEAGKGVDDLAEGDVLVGLPGEGGTRRHEEVGVGGDDAVLLVQVQRLVEALAQLGEVLQGPAQEGHVAADGVPAGEARHGLVGHGLEDGGGHVRGGGALVEQRLHV